MTETKSEKRRRWSRAQKQKLVEKARGLLAKGQTFTAVSKRLGIKDGSLRLWMKQFPVESSLRPVKLIGEAPAPRGISMSTPEGYRFDGLDVESIAMLWEMIR